MKCKKVNSFRGDVSCDGIQREIISLPYPFVGKVKVMAKFDRKLKRFVFDLVIDGVEYR